MICTCPRTSLCSMCLDRAQMWHTGAAKFRGGIWADRVARRRPDLLGREWPDTAKSRAIARRHVLDFSDDPRMLFVFAVHCMRSAAERWEQLRGMSPDERRNQLTQRRRPSR